ncbi:protein SOB FIVE-LIKE 5-like [Diospyros lotus]|uniref:protein SOB FIVE-LIKE 5-like n=1 Tax=Diospyros lotus TaxID=55363 RepID=UPI002259D5BE|nr:protein SOB FIVE-LIKE 5-like [Diospyros lotus]XP_052190411.1 protein SOB FIVE-LIKE 5-like [Diospyros lotus]XP_052190412.1 protein SOB FIVE-LIKE 5-like [Diospyros lotus]
MNISTSECSSGCESGWTMYLDQSSYSEDQFQKAGGRIASEEFRYKAATVEGSYEDEDLSMVSDASSGPPNFQEDDCFDDGTGYLNFGSSASEQKKKREKKKKKSREGNQQHSHFVETTSTLSFSKKHEALSPSGDSMNHSPGFSATHFKGKSALQKRCGFLKSSASRKPS